MGCVCVKPSAVGDSQESPKEKAVISSDKRSSAVSSDKRSSTEIRRNSIRRDGGSARIVSIDKKSGESMKVKDDEVKKEIERKESGVLNYPGIGSVPKAVEGEQVAAGWPSWLSAVAGEAIKGWVPRRADTFEKLDKIGQGTYSNVYRARDLVNQKLVAIKRVRFDNKDPESVKFMAREILLLRRLDHPNIIKLEGLVASQVSCSLYLVFDYMEHDLTGLSSLPGIKFTEPQVKCYMQQLLSGLDHCHSHGILHRDIKGSNLLIDNNGTLKIADFGLASSFDPDLHQPLTSRVVTLWYRPPELLLGATYYGVAVDLWSAGCILAELYAGKPIMPGHTEVEQLHKIFKLCGSPSENYWQKAKLPYSTVFKPQQPYRRRVQEAFKDIPAPALGLIETLLSIDPAHRGTAASALQSEFFTTKPLPCDPSSLPKYPPSKEIDAKLRDEEARSSCLPNCLRIIFEAKLCRRTLLPRVARLQGTVGSKGQVDLERRRPKESWANPALDAKAELAGSMQKRQGHSVSARIEMLHPCREEVSSGFLIDPPRPTQKIKNTRKVLLEHQHERAAYSGPLVPGSAWPKAGKKLDDSQTFASKADLSTLSGLVAARTASSEQYREKSGPVLPVASNTIGKSSGPLGESHRKPDRKHRVPSIVGSQWKDNGNGGAKETFLQGYGSKGNRIYFSGPLLVPSNNVDQVLKEHDRQLQEAVQRARLDRRRLEKAEAQRNQTTAYSVITGEAR
ncbi:Protein kinase domain [Dillenia turbinata]|uniref:Protein kinase domain n=1 Tax=Dillenia turbinata TaxID=194707 RepID=A0AAN8UZ43_9MAGN